MFFQHELCCLCVLGIAVGTTDITSTDGFVYSGLGQVDPVPELQRWVAGSVILNYCLPANRIDPIYLCDTVRYVVR